MFCVLCGLFIFVDCCTSAVVEGELRLRGLFLCGVCVRGHVCMYVSVLSLFLLFVLPFSSSSFSYNPLQERKQIEEEREEIEDEERFVEKELQELKKEEEEVGKEEQEAKIEQTALEQKSLVATLTEKSLLSS